MGNCSLQYFLWQMALVQFCAPGVLDFEFWGITAIYHICGKEFCLIPLNSKWKRNKNTKDTELHQCHVEQEVLQRTSFPETWWSHFSFTLNAYNEVILFHENQLDPFSNYILVKQSDKPKQIHCKGVYEGKPVYFARLGTLRRKSLVMIETTIG